LSEVAPDKKKAPMKGPISLAVHVMVVMMMMMMMEHAAGTGPRRCGNGQREKSCENVGE
jgi:hypothetical protein